jgi:peptidoglycan/LPS O-acetylase OafA/YrhL
MWIGKISYGIYVLHIFIFDYIGTLPGMERVLPRAALATAATVAIAALSWHYFEGPINRLKRHFPYREAGQGINYREAGKGINGSETNGARISATSSNGGG